MLLPKRQVNTIRDADNRGVRLILLSITFFQNLLDQGRESLLVRRETVDFVNYDDLVRQWLTVIPLVKVRYLGQKSLDDDGQVFIVDT